MMKTRFWKAVCMVLATGTVYLARANFIDVPDTSQAALSIASEETSNTDGTILAASSVKVLDSRQIRKVNAGQKKTSDPVITTNLTKEEQKKFFSEYKKYKITKKKGILYYKNKPIRCFADIYTVTSDNATGGVTVNSKSVYSYYYENGKKDIYIERKNIKAGEKGPSGKIIATGSSLERFIFAIPKNSVNKMMEKDVQKQDYENLETFIIYAGQQSIDKAAKQIVANGDGEVIKNIAWKISRNVMGELAVQLVKQEEYNALQDIICYVPRENADKVAEMLYEKGAYTVLYAIAWNVSESTLEKLTGDSSGKAFFSMDIMPFWGNL